MQVTQTTLKTTKNPVASNQNNVKNTSIHPLIQLHAQIGNSAMIRFLNATMIQTKQANQRTNGNAIANHTDNQTPNNSTSTVGNGFPIETSVRNQMESKFNHNFSDVKIHHDVKSNELVSNVGANAFTMGRDIYFGQNKYDPSSKIGIGLLAHELAHVVQQRGEKHEMQLNQPPIESGNSLEMEANSAAISVLENKPVKITQRITRNPIQRGFWDTIASIAKSVGQTIVEGVEAVGQTIAQGAEWLAENVPVVGDLKKLLKKSGDVIGKILDDPIGFLGNLLVAIKGGFNQFSDNIWTHLKTGLVEWLFGTMAEAGITIPDSFDLKSIFGLILQILGLTTSRLRQKAVDLIGEQNMIIFEKVWQYVSTLVTDGPKGLWELIKEDANALIGMVLDSIKNWVVSTVIKKAVTKLASMFNPVGAIIQALITIYDVVTFVVEKIRQINALVDAIMDSLGLIAAGNTKNASDWIEKTLAQMIPLAIGFLANLLGLGGLSSTIRTTVEKIQTTVDKTIDKALAKVIGLFRKDKKTEEEPETDQGELAIQNLHQEAEIHPFDEQTLSLSLAKIKDDYKFSKLTHERIGDEWLIISAKSPEKTHKAKAAKDDWPVGTSSNPIPIIWFKTENDYPTITMGDKEAGPTEGIQLSHDVKLKVNKNNFLKEGTVMKKVGREGEIGLKEKVRKLLEKFGYKKLNKVQIDHVRDLNFEGKDDYENLWPLETQKNQAANAVNYQQVRAKETKSSQPETKSVSAWKDKYFKIFKVRNIPASKGDHGTSKDKPANMDDNGKPI